MALKEVSAQVGAANYDVVKALLEFGVVAKEQLSDGFQADQDLPRLVSEALVKLVPQLQKLEELKTEWQATPVEAGTGVLLGASESVKALLPAPEPLPAA